MNRDESEPTKGLNVCTTFHPLIGVYKTV